METKQTNPSRLQAAKSIQLDIDCDLYWCPSCKAYRRLTYRGSVNHNWLCCEKGHMHRKYAYRLAALDHPPICSC